MSRLRIKCPLCEEHFTHNKLEDHLFSFHHVTVGMRPYVTMITDLYRRLENTENKLADSIADLKKQIRYSSIGREIE